MATYYRDLLIRQDRFIGDSMSGRNPSTTSSVESIERQAGMQCIALHAFRRHRSSEAKLDGGRTDR
ncbi:hypothetical protein SAY87_003078 [Trapa incisa]|nr:hypothetical protein SAY87_003078 [Trapa incisa]